jgi:pectinesterase
LAGQENTITAQGRNSVNSTGGFTFQFCKVAASDELIIHGDFTVKTYLGRPWGNYSRVVFMQSFMSDVVHPDGWLRWESWGDDAPLDKLYYAEFNNRGPGANVSGRVQWPGVHRMIGAADASNFTVDIFIGGNHWLPSTGVRYTPGL